jgi:hypothetical protein
MLMIATGLTAAMPIAAFLRRDLPLFFENFESYKGSGASASDGAFASAGAAPPEIARADLALAATVIARAAPASPSLADLALAGTVNQIIKVGSPKITRLLRGTIGFEFDESPGINRSGSRPIGTWSIVLHIFPVRIPEPNQRMDLHLRDWQTFLDGPMAFIPRGIRPASRL